MQKNYRVFILFIILNLIAYMNAMQPNIHRDTIWMPQPQDQDMKILLENTYTLACLQLQPENNEETAAKENFNILVRHPMAKLSLKSKANLYLGYISYNKIIEDNALSFRTKKDKLEKLQKKINALSFDPEKHSKEYEDQQSLLKIMPDAIKYYQQSITQLHNVVTSIRNKLSNRQDYSTYLVGLCHLEQTITNNGIFILLEQEDKKELIQLAQQNFQYQVYVSLWSKQRNQHLQQAQQLTQLAQQGK